jgi:hypothetical protein
MIDQDNIQDELRNLDSGLPAKSELPFSVPEGYFEGLAGRMLAKVKEQNSSVMEELHTLSPLLAGLSRKNPYSLPDGYFDKNLEDLPFLVKDDAVSPVLKSIGTTMPYTTPKGYFENFPRQVMSKLVGSEAKVVPFFSRTWMRAAVAAVVGGIIFLGGYQLLKTTTQEPAVAQTNTKPDTTDRLVAKNENSVVQSIRAASIEELDAFIKAIPLLPAKAQKLRPAGQTSAEVDELLKDISEKEIETFLNQIPTADADLPVID